MEQIESINKIIDVLYVVQSISFSVLIMIGFIIIANIIAEQRDAAERRKNFKEYINKLKRNFKKNMQDSALNNISSQIVNNSNDFRILEYVKNKFFIVDNVHDCIFLISYTIFTDKINYYLDSLNYKQLLNTNNVLSKLHSYIVFEKEFELKFSDILSANVNNKKVSVYMNSINRASAEFKFEQDTVAKEFYGILLVAYNKYK